MIDFTLWDILRNLLLAARWTLALSLIAFIGGSLVGLALTFLRLTRWPGSRAACPRCSGHGGSRTRRPRSASTGRMSRAP